MKRLLPVAAVFAACAVGCVNPAAMKTPDDVTPKAAEGFVAAPVPSVSPTEVTTENAHEMCRKLQQELDREQANH